MCLSPEKWINNNGVIASTKNGSLSFAAKWLEMEEVSVMELARLGEVSRVYLLPFVETRKKLT